MSSTFYTPEAANDDRDICIDDVMREWRWKYSTFEEVTLCVTTFNVNGKSPPHKVDEWLDPGKHVDFFVVGLQEMDLSVGTYIVDNNLKEKEWIATIMRSLPLGQGTYELVTSVKLVGIFLVILRFKKSSVRVSDIHIQQVPTGFSFMMNKLGNKGGVAASMMLNDTLVCFVNSHLAAGSGEVEQRNQHYHEIRTQLSLNGRAIFDHDVVIWLGDLNYRINAEQTNGLNGEAVRRIASGSEFKALFRYDQLSEQQRLALVFDGFSEASPINFRPTYKYDVGTCTWDTSEKARTPAWCDRILWKVNDTLTQLVQMSYDSVERVMISDHKPVRSLFKLTVRKKNQAKFEECYEEALREGDRRQNQYLPQVALSSNEVDFGEVFFMQPVTRSLTVTNTGKRTLQISLKEHTPLTLKKDEIRAGWVQASPLQHRLAVGQQVLLSFTVTMNAAASWEVEEAGESKQNRLFILVLGHEMGRHHFLSVSMVYNPSCFGVSLQRLTRKKKKNDLLIDFGNETEEEEELPSVPREVYRLCWGARQLGLQGVRFVDVQGALFCRIRAALEQESPRDLTSLEGVSASALYTSLYRLVMYLKDPLVPPSRRSDFLHFCLDASRLWSVVDSFPSENSRLLEYLIDFLREHDQVNPALKELSQWSDVLVRDENGSAPQMPRMTALQTLISYSKDTALFQPPPNAIRIAPPPPRHK